MSCAAGTPAVPSLAGYIWGRALDTALPSPADIVRPEEQAAAAGGQYVAQPRSVVVLEARRMR